MRPKDQKQLVGQLKECYPNHIQLIDFFATQTFTELKTRDRFVFIAVGKQLTFWSYYNSRYFPMLRLLHQYPSMMNDNYISHDKGAISPIFCGAKLMAPGINGGDRDFKAGDIVCLRYDQEVPALGFVKLEQDFTDIMKAGRNGSIGDILLRVGDGFWIFGEQVDVK